MRRTTRRAAGVAIAATFLALAGPVTAAHADFGDTLKGGCGFTTAQNVFDTSGANEGVIYDLSISQEQNGTPSSATVTCWIEVNGNQALNNPLTVTDDVVPGVEAGANQIAFFANEFDYVTECQQVTFADGSTWVAPDGNVGTDCRPIIESQQPPQPILDLLSELKPDLDAVICPVLVTIGQVTGGRIGGAIFINPDGDIYLAQPIGTGNIWVYDCAPYGNGPGTPLITVGSLPITPVFLRLLQPTTFPI